MHYIGNRLEDSQLNHISKIQDAHVVWKKLTDLYQAQDSVTKMYLKDESQTRTEAEGTRKPYQTYSITNSNRWWISLKPPGVLPQTKINFWH